MVGINDHVPVPVGTAIMMTSDQLDDIKAFLSDMHDKQLEQPPAVLSVDQFDELKKLLQPGYELSALMLADYKAQRVQGAPVPVWNGIGALPNNSPDKEWRSEEEIAAGVNYYANQDETIAARAPNASTGEEWRTQEEIASGVPYNASQEATIAARQPASPTV
jgi:hypothetical protein